MDIRNIAIIAHVDHGKTTLVDKMIYACEAIDKRVEKKELILDNNDLEKERGITILSKNVSVNYRNHKIKKAHWVYVIILAMCMGTYFGL